MGSLPCRSGGAFRVCAVGDVIPGRVPGLLGSRAIWEKKKPEIKLGREERERVRKARGERDTGKTGWWSLPSPS